MHNFLQFTRSTLWGRICLSRANYFRGKFCGEEAIFQWRGPHTTKFPPKTIVPTQANSSPKSTASEYVCMYI